MKLLGKLLTILFVTYSLNISAQDISDKYPNLIERVKSINKDTSSFEKHTLHNEEFMDQVTDGGGLLTGYFKSGQVQKITSKVVISYGIETFDYYFIDGQLFFIYETFDGFIYNNKSAQIDYSTTERNFIGRYYFANNKLVDNETTGHNRFEDDKIDMEKVLLSEMNDYLNQLKPKK